MTRIRIGARFMAVAVSFVFVTAAMAGPYSDDLGKCLVSSTTTEEKSALVKWIFSIAALHPAVNSVSAVTDAQRTELSKSTAALFESLLTDRCKTQTQGAVRYEGTVTIQTSFGVLGQAAMMELFSNQAVENGLSDFANYVDNRKLEKVLGKAPSNE